MATARCTLVCFSSASRRPRSANTFPEPGTTASLFFPLAISRLIIVARRLEPAGNQSTFAWGRLYSSRRFLLEGMKNINGLAEFHGIHRTIGVLAVVLDDFQNTVRPETRLLSLPRLGLRMLS